MAGHQEQNEAIRDQFGKQATSYAAMTGAVARNTSIDHLAQTVQASSADRALDVGCGPGRLTVALAGMVGEITGIDLTPQMLAQAKALQAKSNVSNVKWIEGDVLPLPFADGAFTLVVTQATFHHFADPAAVLSEMKRVCAPGGRIAVIDMVYPPAKGLAFDAIEKLRDPSHVRVLSLEGMRELGAAAGLQEIEVWPYGTPIGIEAVLATSFPDGGAEVIERVRSAYVADARSGKDELGLSLREENGELRATYPMTMFAWHRV